MSVCECCSFKVSQESSYFTGTEKWPFRLLAKTCCITSNTTMCLNRFLIESTLRSVSIYLFVLMLMGLGRISIHLEFSNQEFLTGFRLWAVPWIGSPGFRIRNFRWISRLQLPYWHARHCGEDSFWEAEKNHFLLVVKIWVQVVWGLESRNRKKKKCKTQAFSRFCILSFLRFTFYLYTKIRQN